VIEREELMFSRGIPLKLVSLLIALLLAYAVQSARNASVVSLFVPIEVKNAPEDKALVKPAKRGVQVTLKGPSFLIGPVASSPPAIRVKLPELLEDRVSVSFKASDIALPSSIEVLNIEPSQMEFVFEPLERQEVRVEVPRIGQLSQGLILEGVEVSPKVVALRGSRSELKALRVVESDPIDLGDVDETREFNLDLRLSGTAVTPSTRSVVAKVIVGHQPTERIFKGRSIELRVVSGGGGFSVVPEKVAVTLSGPPSVISRTEEQVVIPFIRIPANLPDATPQRKVEVEVPAGIKVVAVEPAYVALKGTQQNSSRITARK
jgi:YbbR domain-containing protein